MKSRRPQRRHLSRMTVEAVMRGLEGSQRRWGDLHRWRTRLWHEALSSRPWSISIEYLAPDFFTFRIACPIQLLGRCNCAFFARADRDACIEFNCFLPRGDPHGDTVRSCFEQKSRHSRGNSPINFDLQYRFHDMPTVTGSYPRLRVQSFLQRCGSAPEFLAVVFCYADVLMRDPMPAKQKCGENKAVVAIPSYSLSCFDPLT